jgi:hypothetical protein
MQTVAVTRTIEISRDENDYYLTTEYAEVFEDGTVELHRGSTYKVTGDQSIGLVPKLTIEQLKTLAAAL